MKYATYYEEKNTITVGRYQQLKQRMLDEGQSYQTEKFTLRKLKFIGNESQDSQADYSLCMKDSDAEKVYLEKKYIQNGMHFKSILKLSREECQRILDGDLEWMKGHKKSLLADFYRQITLNHLSPGYLTDYDREMNYSKKGYRVIFCKKINRGVGITNRLFEEPKMVIPCLDEGKILVTYQRDVKLPKIFSKLLSSQDEQLEEAIS